MNDLFPKVNGFFVPLLLSENNLICLLTPFLISLWFKPKINVVFSMAWNSRKCGLIQNNVINKTSYTFCGC